jgi:hypothetical protein
MVIKQHSNMSIVVASPNEQGQYMQLSMVQLGFNQALPPSQAALG